MFSPPKMGKGLGKKYYAVHQRALGTSVTITTPFRLLVNVLLLNVLITYRPTCTR